MGVRRGGGVYCLFVVLFFYLPSTYIKPHTHTPLSIISPQHDRATGAREDAEGRLGQAKRGVLCGHAEVARQRELQPPPEGGAGDGGDGRDGEAACMWLCVVGGCIGCELGNLPTHTHT